MQKYNQEEANSTFKEILEAYEAIKYDRGLSTKKPLIRRSAEEENDGFQSRRPQSAQYSEDFEREKDKYGEFDSAEYYYRTQGNEKYARYSGTMMITKDSFKEMYEANRTDFKPREGDMPDTVSRFKMDEEKATDKKYSDNDAMKILYGFTALAVATMTYFYFQRVQEETVVVEELEKNTNTVNVAKTTVTKDDLKFSQDTLQQDLITTDMIKEHKRGLDKHMKGQEKILKQLVISEEPMILQKPRNFKQETLKKLKSQTQN